MNTESTIQGLCLKTGPLGETDRLLTILTKTKGIDRVSIPGSRKPKSSLAAASPLNLVELQLIRKKGLKKARQIKILKSYTKLGQRLETLAAAQALIELILMIIGTEDPHPQLLETVLIHLERLENFINSPKDGTLILASVIQSCFHVLAIGGYCIPLQTCCRSGENLIPPLGQWEWRCTFLPEEGIKLGSTPESKITLNPSELALLQRMLKPSLPISKTGDLIGPKIVWLKLLLVLEEWIKHQLNKSVLSLKMIRNSIAIEEN